MSKKLIGNSIKIVDLRLSPEVEGEGLGETEVELLGVSVAVGET